MTVLSPRAIRPSPFLRRALAAAVLLAILAAARAAAAAESAPPGGSAAGEPGDPPCGLVWRAGDTLWQLAPDGTPQVPLRAEAPIQRWTPAGAGHVAWSAGDRLHVRAADSGKVRRLGPKTLRKGRFTRPVGLEFGATWS